MSGEIIDADAQDIRVSPAGPDTHLQTVAKDDRVVVYELQDERVYADGAWLSTDHTVNPEDWQ